MGRAALITVLVIVSAAALLGLWQYGEARGRAESKSRELAATAMSRLPVEPLEALRLALDGAREAETDQVQDALRAAIASPLRAVLRGHEGEIGRVDSSADGRRILTADRGFARVWNAASGRMEHVLRGDDARILDAQFSPDGRVVATAGLRQGVRVWDAATGTQVRSLTETRASGLLFSSNGAFLASLSGDGTVLVWFVDDGEEVGRAEHPSDVTSIAFDRSGHRLVTGARDGRARLWGIPGGVLLRTLPARSRLLDVALSPDARQIATLTRGGRVELWSAETGRRERARRFAGGSPDELEYSGDGRFLLISGGGAHVWEPSTGVSLVLDPDGSSRFARFDDNGERVLIAGDDTKILDTTTGRRLAVLRAGTARVLDARFGADGRTVVTGDDEGVARLWSAGARSIPIDQGSLGSVAFSPDGRRFVTADAGGGVTVRSVSTGQSVASHQLPSPVTSISLAFTRDGKRVQMSLGGGAPRVWTIGTGDVDEPGGEPVASDSVLPSSERRRIASLLQLGVPLEPGATSAEDGRTIAVVPGGSSVALFFECDACVGWDALKRSAAERLGETGSS